MVADSTRPMLVWEVPYYPAYYFPVEDVRMDLLEADGGVAHSPSRGDGRTFASGRGAGGAGAALRYEKVDLYVDGVRQERPSTKFS